MEKNLFRYVWRHTRKEQIWLLVVILMSMPFYFLALDLPKTIVNGPIQGEGFADKGATAHFLSFELTLPDWLSGAKLISFSGIEMERLGYLIALCLVFLALVCINGLFKFYINTEKGRLGERMLRRLRFELVDRVLRFPTTQFRRIKAPEVASMVKDEVEPLGGFIGNAFVQPVFLGGQAITAMAFILVQNVWLGTIAAGIVLTQAFIIPKLRRRLITLGKQRQLASRQLAGRVGEIVDGIGEIRVNDTSNYERADISSRLGRIFFIRYEIYQRKFFVKFLNNFLAQVTPFLFYLIGGYFAIRGQLDIGQLVAVIAAYKDLPSPIKELIDWDQQRLDVQTKYGQVIDQFAPDNMLDPKLQALEPGPVPPIREKVEATHLGIVDDTGATLLEDVSLAIKPGDHVAVVGEINAGGEAASDAFARLLQPTSGQVLFDGQPLSRLTEAVSGRRIAYVGQDPYFAASTLRDAITYSLKHTPGEVANGHAASFATDLQLKEAIAAGNVTYDSQADWIDYAAAGAENREELDNRIVELLQFVGMDEAVFEMGLRQRIDPSEAPAVVADILKARQTLRSRVERPPLDKLVVPFDINRYNRQASLAINLFFGRPLGANLELSALYNHPYFLSVMRETGLCDTLLAMGRHIASTVVELFADLAPGHPFFEQLSFMTADDLPTYQAILKRVGEDAKFDHVAVSDREAIVKLALDYIEPKHRLGLINETLETRLLEVRQHLVRDMPDDLREKIAVFDVNAFNAASSLRDNILFGRVTVGVADGARRVNMVITEVLDELGIRREVIGAGLNSDVGTGGRRLSSAERQRVALMRALIKRPDLLIVNRGLSNLDQRSQTELIERILGLAGQSLAGKRFATLWVLAHPAMAERFDRTVVFDKGRLVEQGQSAQLQAANGKFAELLAS